MISFMIGIIRFIVSIFRSLFNQSLTVVIVADLNSLSPMISKPCLQMLVEKYRNSLAADNIVVIVDDDYHNLPIILFCRDKLGVISIRYDGSTRSFQTCMQKIRHHIGSKYITLVNCPNRYNLQKLMLTPYRQLRKQLKEEAESYA